MMGVGFCGDIRVSRRFEKILEDVTKSGSLVVRKLGADRAAEVGAHRFLGSERVTPQAILEEAAERTARACRGRRVVVAQDTTEINFSGCDKGRRGLGLGGDGRSLRFFVHPLVAIDADDETVLGVAGAKILDAPARQAEESPQAASGGQGIHALDRRRANRGSEARGRRRHRDGRRPRERHLPGFHPPAAKRRSHHASARRPQTSRRSRRPTVSRQRSKSMWRSPQASRARQANAAGSPAWLSAR